MKKSEPMTKTLVLGDRKLKFDQRISDLIEMDDRVIINLHTDDFDYGDPMVGRNILCYDKQGELLWRVEETGMMIGINNDVPQSFFGLYLEEDERITTDNPDAIFYIRPEDGTLYDGEYKLR